MAMASSDIAWAKQTMEALSDFLQNTRKTVGHLCEGHIVGSMQASKQRRSNMPSAFGMLPALGKGLHHPSHDAMADHGAGRAGQARTWSFSFTSNSLDERFLQTSKVGPSGRATPIAYRNLSEAEMEHAIGFFLKDMRNTVDSWCCRYRLLADGKTSFEAVPQPLHSDMQVMDQLDFGPDTDQEFSAIGELDPSHGRDEVLHPCAQNGKALGMPFTKQVLAGNKGGKRGPLNSRAYQNRSRTPAFSMQGMMGSMETAHSLEPSQQDMRAAQESISKECHVENRKMNITHTLAVEGKRGYNIADCKEVDMEKTSTNDSESGRRNIAEGAIVKFGCPDEPQKKSTADVESPVETDELTIRRYQYKVEVVDSPDWLPKGWITELKTRGTGGSAGCKDKYYFDPVSKRRCRSQKEVFCFLETGKLGRYKRRPKLQPVNKLLGIDLEQQVSSSSEMQAANKREVSGMKTSALSQPYDQDNTSVPLAVFPNSTSQRGMVGSTFLPYRPGQSSDLLMYESLANLPRPMSDQYRFMGPSSSKSNGDRSSASRPWFLDNAEGSARLPVDRFEMGKVTDHGGGQGTLRGRRGTDGAPKRARKSSKRLAS